MLTYFLYGLFILSCIVLVVTILLQPGKSDAGSSVSSTAFGPRGTASILAKITIGAAIAFMLIALMLALPSLNGSRSVLQSTPESGPVATPTPVQQPSPAATSAPVTVTMPGTNSTPGSNSGNSNSQKKTETAKPSPKAK